MKRRVLDVRTVVTSVTAAVVVAGAAFLALSALSRPQDFKPRTQTLDREIARVERLSKSTGDPNAYAGGTICDSPGAGAGADALMARTRNAAAAASVALSNLAVTPPAQGAASTPASPVTLQFAASGKYEAVVGMLTALDRDEPAIFIDAADLKPAAAGQVTLKLSGRILCWTSARH